MNRQRKNKVLFRKIDQAVPTDDERIQAFNNTFSAIHNHLSNCPVSDTQEVTEDDDETSDNDHTYVPQNVNIPGDSEDNLEARQNDIVSNMLEAATLGVDVKKYNLEVEAIVKELLPLLVREYKDKIIDDDLISESRDRIFDHVEKSCDSFKTDVQKVYLRTSIEKCLQVYKHKNVTEQSVNILSDIGTAIYQAILKSEGLLKDK